jgi:Xaa-Pro aminopeptidase
VFDAVIALARPGVACNELHNKAEEIINEAGFRLIHRVGYGVGLATSFEWPSLDTETTLLQPGMTFAVEPGIYEPGAGAMKIEDMVVITETGCELLSQSHYDLEIRE